MLYPEIKIAAGWNNAAGFQSIEAITGVAPRTTPVPLGAVPTQVLSGKVRVDGQKNIDWFWNFLLASKLDAIVTAYLTNYNTSSAQVTIRTLTRARTYANYNAWLSIPLINGNDLTGVYEQPTTTKLTNVRLVFTALIAI